MSLTFRDTKGSPLTSEEGDQNVRELAAAAIAPFLSGKSSGAPQAQETLGAAIAYAGNYGSVTQRAPYAFAATHGLGNGQRYNGNNQFTDFKGFTLQLTLNSKAYNVFWQGGTVEVTKNFGNEICGGFLSNITLQLAAVNTVYLENLLIDGDPGAYWAKGGGTIFLGANVRIATKLRVEPGTLVVPFAGYLDATAAGLSYFVADAARNNEILDSLFAASLVSRKTLRFPASDQPIPIARPMNYDPRAKAGGWGRQVTGFIATQAMPYMLGYAGTTLYEPSGVAISSLALDCAGLAQTGLNMQASAFGGAEDIYIKRALDFGLKVRGNLISSWKRIHIEFSEKGILAEPLAGVNTPYENNVLMPPNSLHFEDLSLVSINSTAIDYSGGSSLVIDRLGIEICGREYSAQAQQTPLIYVHDVCGYYPSQGLVINVGHCERPGGGAFIHFDEAAGRAHHAIRDFEYSGLQSSGKMAIKMTANNQPQMLTLDNVVIASVPTGQYTAGHALVVEGAQATVIVRANCLLPQGFSRINGGKVLVEVLPEGTYTPLTLTNGGTTPTPPPTPTPGGSSASIQESDSRIRYSSGSYNDGTIFKNESSAFYSLGSGSYSTTPGAWYEVTIPNTVPGTSTACTGIRFEGIISPDGGAFSMFKNDNAVSNAAGNVRSDFMYSAARSTAIYCQLTGLVAGDVIRLLRSNGNGTALYADQVTFLG